MVIHNNFKIIFVNFNKFTQDKVNERGKMPIKDLLKFIGGYPMIEHDWDENNWSWENAILKLRQFIAKRTNNIFSKPKEPNDIRENVSKKKLINWFNFYINIF